MILMKKSGVSEWLIIFSVYTGGLLGIGGGMRSTESTLVGLVLSLVDVWPPAPIWTFLYADQ